MRPNASSRIGILQGIKPFGLSERSRLVAVVAAGLLVVVTPIVAFAHARLKSSSPSAGEHLAAAPREIRLNFSEVPELTFTSVQLLDPSGRPVALGPIAYAADSKRAVIAVVRGAVVSGDYTVVWQVAGDDGHPVRDRFRFVIAPGAAGIGAVVGGMTMDTAHHNPVSMPEGIGFGADAPAYVLVRWAAFMALLFTIGAVAFRQLVVRFLRRKEEPDSPMLDDAARRAARLGQRAAIVFLVVLLLRLGVQSLAMHGRTGMLDPGLVIPMLLRTSWGFGWLAQLAGIVIAIIGFRRANTADGASAKARRGWFAALVGVIVLAFASGLAGHAVAAPRLQVLTLIADGFHVIGAGGWLGSLAVVLLAGIPAALALPEGQRGAMVAELFNAFSPTALMFAGIVAATGVFAAWIHVGSIPAIWQTPYGRILLLKLVVLSFVAGTGAYNWLRVKPTLGQGASVIRIRRSATTEIAVGIVVLLITAILVATPTAMDMKM